MKKILLCLILTSTCVLSAQTLSDDPIVQHIDKSVRPQDDFFQYANGAWFQANAIPASEQENGIFKTIQDTVDAQVYRICQEAITKRYPYGSAKQKIGDFYFTAMDSVTSNREGIEPLREDLIRIQAIEGLDELLIQSAYVSMIAGSPFFGCYVGQDEMDSEIYTLHLSQGGLSLPDKRYYIESDAQSEVIRKEFRNYVKTLFLHAGLDEEKAQKATSDVWTIEEALARTSRNREDTRDPFENYHLMSVDDLLAVTPNFYWPAFFRELNLPKIERVVVEQPEFFIGLNRILSEQPITSLRNYLAFQLLDGLAPYAGDSLYLASFKFYSGVLRGIEEPRPRWKRAVGMTDRILGDLVGQIYVDEYLPKNTKEKFLEIGNAVRAELAIRIQNLSWMSNETKVKALDKLNAVVMKLAYPDQWKDLSKLHVTRTSYLKNMMAYHQWATTRNLQRLGHPVDRQEWYMQPQTYNAYYSPSNNEICIPGCNIIVPGFDGMPDDAILYAIIGGTFGHEITHGFDDQGCLFDKKGNLENWWTVEDKERFDTRTKQIVNQFDKFYITDSLHINGSLTQGENIADLGGVIIALEAFKKTEAYKSGKEIGGFNPLQRFFLGYALAWMEQMRPEALQNQVKSNEHAPAKWRVNGPLANIPDFYEAFGLKSTDKMYRAPEERIVIW